MAQKVGKADSSILADDAQKDEAEMNINEEGKANDIEMTNEEKKDNGSLDVDVIAQHFKGRVRQIISFTGADGKQKTKETVIDSFAAILVRVIGFKEIYEAWENQYRSTIDDYKENDTLAITKQNSQISSNTGMTN